MNPVKLAFSDQIFRLAHASAAADPIRWLLAGLACGYAFAWVGHYFFEHNRPATFTYLFYSYLGDWSSERPNVIVIALAHADHETLRKRTEAAPIDYPNM